MTHATELDLGPLTWVKGEIELALARADEALAQAAEAPGDTGRIQFAQTHLHQARGALSIVGLDGLTQFASSLGQLLAAMGRGERPAEASSISLCRRALAATGNYLEELAHGAPDQALRLYPLYAELAAARGLPAASPADLFFPDLTRRPPRRSPSVPALSEEARQRRLRSLRASFERGLLQWLRQPADVSGPRMMHEAVTGIEALQTSPPLRALWWAALALLDGFAQGELPAQPEVKRLCARLDAQIRQLSDGLPTVPDGLMREVLYWSTQAPARTEQQRAVRSTWSLDCLLPESGSVVSETPLAPLLKALQALIGSAKQHWDEFCGGQVAALLPFETQVESLAAQVPQLGRPALDRLFAGLRAFSQWLRKDPLKFNEAIGLEVATALLLGESALERGVPESGFSTQASDTVDRLSALMRGEAVQAAEASRTVEAARRSQEKQALVQLAREIRSSLAQVEQTLDDYFRNQEKRGQLAGLATPLKQIEGALTLLGDDGAIALVREVAGTVSVFAEATETPDPGEFESLAQRLSALGFYVEALQHGRASLESFLNPQATAVAEPAPEVAPDTAKFPEPLPLPEAAPEPVAERPAAEEEAPAVEPIEALPADEGFQIEFPAEPAPLPEPAPDTRKLIEASDEEIDAELLAIFIEEAHEVLATIAEELELSRTEPTDAEHLTSIRRGFHTLKGSGRMVGLRELGEAAWGMEQTLNRWLQLEWVPTSALHHLIDDAHQAFSAWVGQLEAGGGQGRDVAALLTEAERLRSGDQPIGEPVPSAERAAPAEPAGAAAAAAEESAPALVETSLDFLELTVGDDGEVQPYGQAEESAAPLLDEISLEELSEELVSEESSPAIPEPGPTEESVPAAEAAADGNAFPALDFGAPAIDITSTNLESDWGALEEVAPDAEPSPETLDDLAVDLDLGVLAETEAEPSVEPAEAIESLELLAAEELGEPGAGFAPPLFAEAPAEATAELPAQAEGTEPAAASALPVTTPDADLEILLPEDTAEEILLAMPEGEEVHADIEAASETAFAFAEPFDEALAEPESGAAGASAGPDTLPEPAMVEPEEPAAPESAMAEPEESTAPESPAVEEAVEEPAAAAVEDANAPPEPDLVRVGEVEVSRALYDLYLAEARQHLATLHAELGRMRANPTLVPSEETLRAVHTLAGISGTTRMQPLHGLARALEHALGRLRTESQPPSPEALDLLDRSSDILQSMLAEVSTGRMPLAVPELGEQLETVGRELPEGEEEAPTATASTAETPLQVVSSVPAAAETGAAEAEAAAVHDDLDEQLLPIFLEESEELLSALHAELRAWRADSTDGEHAKPVARLLHTLKGSARMAGAMLLGEHVHQIESRLESAQHAGADPMALIEELESGLDLTEQMIACLTTKDQPAEQPSGSLAAPAFVATVEAAPEAESAGGGTLRVRAEMVDRFVNEAGEIGIARTRIEGELRTLRRSLLDLTENVIRLRNQLREVEIQAEVQMQSRIAQAESHHAEFDPLEMDRYTRLQELTRMMAESVGDVTTVQQNLLRNLDAADLALHSQARLSRELQQALMQVRMVPFDSLADRLYRVVRQSAKDLGKRANLDLRGGRIEIDRSVLEHMVAPLEHLLRNAVAHGIEDVQARRAAGKDEIGQITLSVSQEGNEIAISLADDGGGLDYARIAERARANGLLGPDEVADERRLTNLIFVPGFSTAGNLSAISGRGVGMDVVKSETAAVGGRIDVHATPGTGTEFHIYLPLTLAVTQALLVRAANRTYAIPSSMIAQVLELKSDALETLRREGGTEWQGEHYGYRYLPHLLGDRGAHPEQQRFNWVLLLRAGAQALALHVDGLRGNHEIVVKNAGPQLVRIVGISGATVLGDGEIVLILNPVALASRSLVASEVSAEAPAPATAGRGAAYQPTVMVVDDSLTVRKITGRLLEREGYRVVTAKDGVDALERLLETLPDVILSDIEMPRMDGFDLLRNIRADARTHGIPVIMITSRLADKHREYAEKIGANHYLGKPYEEEELLALLQGYTSAAAAA